MKQKLLGFMALALMAASFWGACNKPSPFGSDLLEDELGEFVFNDTLTVVCTIEREDSLLTSDRASIASAFLCGELDDPVFGKSSSEIFSLLQLDFLDPGFDSVLQQFDSIVLYLRYASGSVYGDTTQPQTLRVFRLTEPLSDEKDYYSINSLAAGEEIGAVSNFIPTPNRVDSLFDPTSKSAYLRVPLKNSFGNELFKLDTGILQNDSAFYAAVRGIKIATTANASPGAMLAFDLNNENYSRIRLYYHNAGDTIVKFFDFFFAGANKFTHFTHDYNGTQAGQAIGQQADDFLYVQGMQGLRLKIEFPYADRLEDIAVNKAQLVLTTVADNNPYLASAKQLVFTENLGDSLFVFSSDVLYSLGPALNQGFDRFGGKPEKENVDGNLVERYRLTLSQRFQDIVDDTSGDLSKKTIYMNVSPQSRTAARTVFFGPKNVTFPAKLELKYTRVQ